MTTTCKPTVPAIKKRQLTVCNKGFRRAGGHYRNFPDLRLCGKWLQEAGFCPGLVIDITCEEGCLIITPAKEQRHVVT